MTRNYSKDEQIFEPKEDLDKVAKLYYSHESEVRHFLRERNASGNLDKLSVLEVYDLIADKLGYAVPN